jgi:hypothetical protein
MASQEPTVLASVSSRPLPLWQGDLSTEEYALLQKEYWSTNGYFGLTAPPAQDLSTLKRHNVDSYTCFYCLYDGNGWPSKVRSHIESVHMKLRPFKCDHCFLWCHSRHVRDRHIAEIHTQDEVLKCAKCPFTTHSQRSIEHHAKVHKRSLEFQCTTCSLSFKSSKSLKKHTTRVHSKKKFHCTLSQTGYASS